MMGAFEFLSNDRLVDEVERGLRKGYWDKALIPELKKRFIELEKKEKLLEELKNDVARFMTMNEFSRLFTDDERDEYQKLWKKLAKVGKEE